MKLLNESWEILQEADKPAKVVFGQKDLTDPSSISLKDTAKKAVEDEEEAEEQARIATAAEDYKELLDKVRDEKDRDNQLEILFDALVPSSGKAESFAGELVRAIMRILYRDYNDGDVFYEDYGLETAGPSAAFLMTAEDEEGDLSLYDDIVDIAEDALENSAYTDAIEDIGEKIVNYILDHPESLAKKNTIDSRDYDTAILNAYIPTYEYDVYVPDDLQGFIDDDKVTMSEARDFLEELLEDEPNVDNYYVREYGDHFEVSDLSHTAYDRLEELDRKYGIFSDFVEELEEKYDEED